MTTGIVIRTGVVLLSLAITVSAGAAEQPTAAEIESAVNEGVDLEHAPLQSISGLKIISGGQTARGDVLYLCDAALVWSVDIDGFLAVVRKEMSVKLQKTPAAEELFSHDESIERLLRSQLGSFKKGDAVVPVRLRVRLEQAGGNWIVTALQVKATELRSNPLDALKPRNR
jgi:hypothetical protein